MKISFLCRYYSIVLLIENYRLMKQMIHVGMDFHNNLNKLSLSPNFFDNSHFVLKEDLMMIEGLHSNQKEFLEAKEKK